jgi:hypothetical protein
MMNEGKEEAAFRYPDSFVQLLGYMGENIFIYHTDKLKKLLELILITKKYHLYQTTVQ